MRGGHAPAVATSAGCGLASLLLAFDLVAAPLLVACIREDGRVLIEIAGHDACHEESGREPPAMDAAHPASPAVARGDWHDPCLDLSLYKPADAGGGGDLSPHSSGGIVLEPHGPVSCGVPQGRGMVHRPPPKWLPPASDRAFAPLRI